MPRDVAHSKTTLENMTEQRFADLPIGDVTKRALAEVRLSVASR